jgi:uncharacterized protein (DUF169 family)
VTTATRLFELLGLERQPVAVAFRDSAPEGLERIEASAVSGCAYWKLAAEGQTFFTEAADHYGCPVGSYTHGIDLPEENAKELEGLVTTMVQLEYLDMDEVPDIPQRKETFSVALYAPLADAVFDPDAVLISGTAKQMMLLAEAAQSAGVACDSSMVGRPTCAAIPAVMQSGRSATNLGCIGNRVYTEIDDDELYFIVNGAKLDQVVDRLVVIVNANNELEKFHRARLV